MKPERIGVLMALALVGCEQVERIQAARAYHARANELLQEQRDLTAKRLELQKSLESETWGRPNDYQLQRDGTKVRLWRAIGDAPDKEGKRLGRTCVLNPEPREPWSCDVQQRKIGRVLIEMEENDKRYWATIEQSNELYHQATTDRDSKDNGNRAKTK
jgi:hypothetical protein